MIYIADKTRLVDWLLWGYCCYETRPIAEQNEGGDGRVSHDWRLASLITIAWETRPSAHRNVSRANSARFIPSPY